MKSQHSQHQGTTITDLIEQVYSAPMEHFHKSPAGVRSWPSAIDHEGVLRGGSWLVLANAKAHLANHEMTAGDERAWRGLDRALDAVLGIVRVVDEGCIASVGTNATGEEGFICGKPVVGENNLCAAHDLEFN